MIQFDRFAAMISMSNIDSNQMLQLQPFMNCSSIEQEVQKWLKGFPYPACKKANSMGSLRNGVAIAEILADRLPKHLHGMFLPFVEIYNTNPQRSILNLKVLLSTLKSYFSSNPEVLSALSQFNPEGLYFDHNMMSTFVHTILMPLGQQLQAQLLPKALKSQEIDIANLSSIINNQQRVPLQPLVKHRKTQQSNQEQQRVLRIQQWLRQAHHIDCNILQPEEILGGAVNSIFAGGRLDSGLIIKQSHYDQGPIAVFKKICDYLLECQRMPKGCVLALSEEAQEGEVREEIFWAVLEDLMALKQSHHQKNRSLKKKNPTNSSQNTATNNKQNILTDANTKNATKASQKSPQLQTYSPSTLLNAEKWIRDELGYEYSLNKSKVATKIEENPMLNGVLLGSIVMRLQIGKVNTIKQPRNRKDIERNLSEVINCIARRGIQAIRKLGMVTATYQNYLGIMWQVKEQSSKKVTLQKIRRREKAKTKITIEIQQSQKVVLRQWLLEKGVNLEVSSHLPSGVLSEVCGQVLELRLFRQTTQRIKEQNMHKILEQLRRIGCLCDFSTEEVLSSSGQNIRWAILGFTLELVRQRAFYFR